VKQQIRDGKESNQTHYNSVFGVTTRGKTQMTQSSPNISLNHEIKMSGRSQVKLKNQNKLTYINVERTGSNLLPKCFDENTGGKKSIVDPEPSKLMMLSDVFNR